MGTLLRWARAWGLGITTWKDKDLHHSGKTLYLTVLAGLGLGAALLFPCLARAGRPFLIGGWVLLVLIIGWVNYAFHYAMKDAP